MTSTQRTNDNGPSPCDEGPLEGGARSQMGWLMGYKMAT
jgi:hypothetical protein